MRRRVRDALFSLSDRICARAGAGTDAGVTHPWMFEIGHQIGELGWKLRRPGMSP
jgi:hypothetical protein